MISIRFEQNNNVCIFLKYQSIPSMEFELNLNRKKDEAISKTFFKLNSNLKRQMARELSIKVKKGEQKLNISSKISDSSEDIPINLYDLKQNLVLFDTRNEDAWKENYILRINEKEFKVVVDLPYVKTLTLPKILIAGFPAHVKTDFEPNNEATKVNSKYFWYYSNNTYDNEIEECLRNKNKILNFENVEWKLMDIENNGQNIQSCYLDKSCYKKLIKVVCLPHDGNREGFEVEQISTTTALEEIDPDSLPMTARHKLTESYLESNEIRVMSYNILANCHADSKGTKEKLYDYCSLNYLDCKYRRVLLTHEIKNYKSDIIFLQECDASFVDDLNLNFGTEYTVKYKAKNESFEGECTLVRKKRYRFIKSYDILIADELENNVIFRRLLKNLSIYPEIKELISKRNTILQVMLVEVNNKPDHYILLANTHLFYHAKADFTRLVQSIICAKYLENLKNELLIENDKIKQISTLFGGDFNSCATSYVFNYLSRKTIPIFELTQDEKNIFKECLKDYSHSMNLSAYTKFTFTHCIKSFESLLDYVFYDSDTLELRKIIPFCEKIHKENYMPSQFIPSDHVAIIFEFLIK